MIKYDLRTALPVIADAWRSGRLSPGACHATYSSPCVLGVAMTADERADLKARGRDHIKFRDLVHWGLVEVPSDEQLVDISMLQTAFDGGDCALFARELTRLEAKYGAELIRCGHLETGDAL